MPDPRKSQPSRVAQFIAGIPWGEEESKKPPIEVRFDGKREVNARIEIARTLKTRAAAEKQLASILPKDSVAALLDTEDKLFAWLEKSPSNPARFALDPLAALHDAGIKLDPRTYEALARRRAGQRRSTASSLDGLASLTIEIAKPDGTRR